MLTVMAKRETLIEPASLSEGVKPRATIFLLGLHHFKGSKNSLKHHIFVEAFVMLLSARGILERADIKKTAHITHTERI